MEQTEVCPKVAMFIAALITVTGLTVYAVDEISEAIQNKVVKVYHQQEDGTFVHVE